MSSFSEFWKLVQIETKPEESFIEELFRCSFGLSGVPIHGKYYGFLLNAWAKEQELLDEKDTLLNIFMNQVSSYVGFKPDDWWFMGEIGYESPVLSFVGMIEARVWEFRVERDGLIIFETEGYF